jgi:uncharacterized protein YraI
MNPIDTLVNDTAIATTLGKTMHRRSLVKTLAGIGAAAMAVKTIGPAAAHHTEQTYTVSSTANFRSGPGTTYAIIGVVSKGATFQINGQVQNGYAGIIYGGKTGWVLASLIVEAGGGAGGSVPTITGESVTTGAANLRSGPGTSYAVLKVVPYGSLIGTSTTVQNGFRYVSHNGLGGWMHDAYTGFGGPSAGPEDGSATTTANVNFRTEPSPQSSVIQVIPKGSKVQVLPTVPVNDFFNVAYNGKTGWVYTAYLQT